MSLHRRTVLAAAAGLALARPARADRPEPQAMTPDLLAAAKKEGKIAWYTADDLVLATRVAKAFEAEVRNDRAT